VAIARARCGFSIAVALFGSACGGALDYSPHEALPPAKTYGDYGDQALTALRRDMYAGDGLWFGCDGGCGKGNQDWGVDSLTYALYLRWATTHDASLAPIFAALTSTSPAYGSCMGPSCGQWSDVPEWDAIADAREFEVTRDPKALDLSKRAYAAVRDSDAYARGACPTIRYQHPFGGGGGLKTLETDSNAIKAGLLLFGATGETRYLDEARATYEAVGAYFLDPQLPLYTVYVYDDGKACTQLPHRFFASAQGNMIWNGLALADATGDGRFREQALATARAVDTSLSDARGVFADLQAENDVVEPLVEAFFVLAHDHGDDAARAWILRNAQAAAGARTPDGLYGRFFDGPVPSDPVTAWQTNGGLALAIAAAALTPNDPVTPGDWSNAQRVPHEISELPSSLAFTGSGIALLGTLGERCCEAGHAGVSIDGTETVDRSGIWQNKSSAGQSFADAILFAWRWPQSGAHTLDFAAETTNVKEGGPFLHVRGYLLLP
jgi:hypothetical protein